MTVANVWFIFSAYSSYRAHRLAGQGHHFFKVATGVRIPVGVPFNTTNHDESYGYSNTAGVVIEYNRILECLNIKISVL